MDYNNPYYKPPERHRRTERRAEEEASRRNGTAKPAEHPWQEAKENPYRNETANTGESAPTAAPRVRRVVANEQANLRQRSWQPPHAPHKTADEKRPFPVFLLLAALVVGLGIGMYRAAADYIDARKELKAFRAERAALEEQLQSDQEAWERKIALYRQIQYRTLIEQYAAQNGLDPAFISAIIKCESDFVPTAVSSKNAKGLMQFMPDTFSWVAPKCGISASETNAVFDPEKSIKMGSYLVRYITEQFDGDPVLTACAYHAGWGNVKTWLKKYSSDGAHLQIGEIPTDDTRAYARKVMDAYAIYQQYVY